MSGDAPSLHITVGLITKTWADLLLESISELALSEPGFRRSLPAGFAERDFDRELARRHFDQLTGRSRQGEHGQRLRPARRQFRPRPASPMCPA